MDKMEQYIRAATRENTRKSYQSAITHYEMEWGGFLPATADDIASYLVAYASRLAISTLRQRLAAIATWHNEQGFPDPTKAPHVKKVIKGIAELHPHQSRQAKPFQLMHIEAMIHWMECRLLEKQDYPCRNKLLRDRSLILLGFWRAFRSDELTRLRYEHIEVIPGKGLKLYLPRSKTDRSLKGRYYHTPALQRLCPVLAYCEWIEASGIEGGAIFTGINKWGHISQKGLNPVSVISIIRDYAKKAGISEADGFSSHSLRRGFASWANANNWNTKTLMDYVGWKDVKSAMRYISEIDPFFHTQFDTLTATQRPLLRLEGDA